MLLEFEIERHPPELTCDFFELHPLLLGLLAVSRLFQNRNQLFSSAFLLEQSHSLFNQLLARFRFQRLSHLRGQCAQRSLLWREQELFGHACAGLPGGRLGLSIGRPCALGSRGPRPCLSSGGLKSEGIKPSGVVGINSDPTQAIRLIGLPQKRSAIPSLQTGLIAEELHEETALACSVLLAEFHSELFELGLRQGA